MDYIDHMEDIEEWFATRMRSKYLAGQREHGGRLWRKPQLTSMTEEVVDLVVYLSTHEEQIEQVLALLMKAINILTIGNPEGEMEEER